MPEHLPLFIHSLATDKDGNVIVATNKGIYAIDHIKEQARFFQYVPIGEYVSVAFDKKGRC